MAKRWDWGQQKNIKEKRVLLRKSLRHHDGWRTASITLGPHLIWLRIFQAACNQAEHLQISQLAPAASEGIRLFKQGFVGICEPGLEHLLHRFVCGAGFFNKVY